MVLWVLTAPEGLNSVPGPHMVEGEYQLTKVVL